MTLSKFYEIDVDTLWPLCPAAAGHTYRSSQSGPLGRFEGEAVLLHTT